MSLSISPNVKIAARNIPAPLSFSYRSSHCWISIVLVRMLPIRHTPCFEPFCHFLALRALFYKLEEYFFCLFINVGKIAFSLQAVSRLFCGVSVDISCTEARDLIITLYSYPTPVCSNKRMSPCTIHRSCLPIFNFLFLHGSKGVLDLANVWIPFKRKKDSTESISAFCAAFCLR